MSSDTSVTATEKLVYSNLLVISTVKNSTWEQKIKGHRFSFRFPFFNGCRQQGNLWSLQKMYVTLTLRLLMSYIYGAPSKARNANVVYIWTYVWQRWDSLFLFAAQCFNTESKQRGFLWHRKPLCIDSVLKHCAANRKRLSQRCQT